VAYIVQRTENNRQVMCIARARVRVIYQLLRVQSYYRYLNRTNNVVHTAAEGVAGVAVADRMMNQVGYRRNIHFHLRNLLPRNLHRLGMPK
jgi:hypothetical protein